jgi:hypothetical protein
MSKSPCTGVARPHSQKKRPTTSVRNTSVPKAAKAISTPRLLPMMSCFGQGYLNHRLIFRRRTISDGRSTPARGVLGTRLLGLDRAAPLGRVRPGERRGPEEVDRLGGQCQFQRGKPVYDSASPPAGAARRRRPSLLVRPPYPALQIPLRSSALFLSIRVARGTPAACSRRVGGRDSGIGPRSRLSLPARGRTAVRCSPRYLWARVAEAAGTPVGPRGESPAFDAAGRAGGLRLSP